MFTGIAEELGVLKHIHRQSSSLRLDISAREVLVETREGDSISVNGVCLTVTGLGGAGFSADVMPNTYRRTNLSALAPGSPVNLERALQLKSRLGGHLVTGHIDEVGTVILRRIEENAVRLGIQCSPEFARFVVERGSVAIDGISLTVSAVSPEGFEVGIIPHTRDHTTLDKAGIGSKVNLESDILARYVEKLLNRKVTGRLSMDDLVRQGF